jgi:hypothetical protein
MIWKKLSTIGAWSCGIAGIIHAFFGKYLTIFVPIFVIIEILGLITFIISEIIKFIIRNKQENKK